MMYNILHGLHRGMAAAYATDNVCIDNMPP